MLEGSSSCQQVPLLMLKGGVHVVPPQRLRSKLRCTGWKRLTWSLHLVWRAETAGSIISLGSVDVLKNNAPPKCSRESLQAREVWGRTCQHLLPHEPLHKGANAISAFSITALRILFVCDQRNHNSREKVFCCCCCYCISVADTATVCHSSS